jgi:hypothetical protein
VVTRALFAQRDFTDRSILEDFYHSLAASFKVGLGEGGGEVTMRLAEPTTVQTYPSSSASSTNGTVDSTLDPEQEARRLEALRIKKGKQKERSGEAAMYMGTKFVRASSSSSSSTTSLTYLFLF